MSMRALVVAAIAWALVSCGVKSGLEPPMGQVLQQDQKDPSRPPVVLGQPGGTIPPYPTGP
jgi:predicted small lipoprotein YifL